MTSIPAPFAPGSDDADAAIHPTERIAALLPRLRAAAPRVHAITNVVAQNFTANLLLAAGVNPSMTVAADEVADFTARANALLINIGTLDPVLRQSIPLAIGAARDGGKPWAFDPVLVDRSGPRLTLARAIMAQRPTVLRCNRAEFAALHGALADERSVQACAARQGTVIAVTGATDIVADATRIVRVSNGHPLMARVTAVGCAGTALIAAIAAVEPDALVATVAGLAFLGIAGELAAEVTQRPGTFGVALIDAIDALSTEHVRRRLRIEGGTPA